VIVLQHYDKHVILPTIFNLEMRNETIANGKTMNIEIKLGKCGHKEAIISHQMYVKINVVSIYGLGFPLCVSVNVKMNI
jgi:hypothetical protein